MAQTTGDGFASASALDDAVANSWASGQSFSNAFAVSGGSADATAEDGSIALAAGATGADVGATALGQSTARANAAEFASASANTDQGADAAAEALAEITGVAGRPIDLTGLITVDASGLADATQGITISGLPEGSTIAGATAGADQSVTLAGALPDPLELIVPVTFSGPFTLTLEAVLPEGATTDAAATATATQTISVAPGTVQPGVFSIAADDPSQEENDEGFTTAFSFTVIREDGSDGEITVPFTIDAPASQANSQDFADITLPFTDQLMFGDGETEQTITVAVSGDDAFEPDESFTVTLGAPSGGASLGEASAAAIIENDDDAPINGVVNVDVTTATETVEDVTELPVDRTVVQIFELPDGCGEVQLLLNLDGSVDVTLVLEDGTIEDADAVAGLLELDAVDLALGQTPQSFAPAPITADPDQIETSGPIGDPAIQEAPDGDPVSAFAETISFSIAPGGSLIANEAILDALADLGFAATGPEVSFPNGFTGVVPGVTSQDLSSLIASGPANVDVAVQQLTTVTTSVARLTTTDFAVVETVSVEGALQFFDDAGLAALGDTLEAAKEPGATPVLSIADAATIEGAEGATPLEFTVSLSEALSEDATFSVSTANGAATAGEDFAALDGESLEIAAGDTNATITVQVFGDRDEEADETFTVTLTPVDVPSNVDLADLEATGEIENDDVAPQPGVLSIAPAQAQNEGDVGATSFGFVVSRNGGTDGAVAASFAVTSAAADAADFAGGMLPTGQVSFIDGQDTAEITIEVAGDTEIEGDESFTVTLSQPTGGAGLGTASAQGVILNDDTPPPGDLSFDIFAVDTSTDEIITRVEDGAVLDAALFAGREVSLAAFVAGEDPGVDSVALVLNDGAARRNENVEPFALFGDDTQGDFFRGVTFEGGAFTLELTGFSEDGGGGETLGDSVLRFSIGAGDGAPIAEDDHVDAREGQAISIDVLANDRDPDGDDLEIVSVSAPQGGEARIVDGEILYTPSLGFTGEDRFEYEISDGVLTDTAQVEVSVAPGLTLRIVDAETSTIGRRVFDDELVSLSEEDVDLADLGFALVGSDEGVGSVRLTASQNGETIAERVENAEPYALFGDFAGRIFAPETPLAGGSITLAAQLFDQRDGAGEELDLLTFDLFLEIA